MSFNLDAFGVSYGEPGKPIDPFNVKICREFLRRCERTKTARLSSYWLKHRIEEWAGRYVRNGECIQAALDLGLIVDPSLEDRSPNVNVGISLRSAQRLSMSREAAEAALSTRGLLGGRYDDEVKQ